MFDRYVERYHDLFGFWVKGLHAPDKESIKIIHYIGKVKPWNEDPGDKDNDWTRTRRMWIEEYMSLI
jgi:lipopolysaccharide biosynthesis glycosyltransferase